jgi:1,2-diacylglycerol 3-alpha-glucosyltransferase
VRVAIFAESYLPYLSGVTVSTETLARGLGAAGHEVLLVAPEPRRGAAPRSAGAAGPDPQYAWLPSYQAIAPVPPGYRMPLPLPSRALRQAAAFAPDIVHAQSPFVSGLMARRLSQRLRVPLVFTHHTRFGDYRHYLGPLSGVGARTVNAYLRDFWAGCAAVIAPGSELADEIAVLLGGRAAPLVRSIPTGLDLTGIRALAPVDPRARHGWPADSVVVISVGRLAPEKSVDLLVDAFAQAAGSDARLRLLLVGAGPAEDELRARTATGPLSGRVAITGGLPRADALGLARGSDLFLFASRTETQGLVLAEALAAGLPVVARDGPGVRDAVREGIDGRIVAASGDSDDARHLADALVTLTADADARAAAARHAVDGAERFDVGQRIGEVVELYHELLTGRTTGG